MIAYLDDRNSQPGRGQNRAFHDRALARPAGWTRDPALEALFDAIGISTASIRAQLYRDALRERIPANRRERGVSCFASCAIPCRAHTKN